AARKSLSPRAQVQAQRARPAHDRRADERRPVSRLPARQIRRALRFARLIDVRCRFRTEHATAAVGSRARALLCDQYLNRRTGCVAFEPAGLPVESLQGGELLYVPEFCLADGGFE